MAVDNPGVDQVSRPMQIALVAVVLLAGMWFTVLKPKPADDSAPTPAAPAVTPASAPAASASSTDKVAPGVKGLASAVDKAKAASATSDQANAKVQAATGGSASTSAPAATASTKTPAATPAVVKHTAAKSAAKAKATKPAAAKTGTKAATAPAADVDPSERLLAYLKHGKTLVILFEGKGADDKAARKAVHQTALKDPKHVVSAYVPINQVGKYEAITSDVQVLTAPTVLVISTAGKATPLTGYVDATVVRQAVADARRAAAAAK